MLSVGTRVALDTTRRADLRVHFPTCDMSTEYDILFCTHSSARRWIGRCAWRTPSLWAHLHHPCVWRVLASLPATIEPCNNARNWVVYGPVARDTDHNHSATWPYCTATMYKSITILGSVCLQSRWCTVILCMQPSITCVGLHGLLCILWKVSSYTYLILPNGSRANAPLQKLGARSSNYRSGQHRTVIYEHLPSQAGVN